MLRAACSGSRPPGRRVLTAGFVAVICSLFAAFDDPIPAMSSSTIWVIAFVPLAGDLPIRHSSRDRRLSGLAFALRRPSFRSASRWRSRSTLALGLPLAVGMSLQPRVCNRAISADMAAFLNSSTAVVIGSSTGVAVTQLIRVIGSETGARRLLRAGWRDLADLANRTFQPTRADWASRMLDRVGLSDAAPGRAGPIRNLQPADALRDLRTGINIIDLRQIAPVVPRAGAHATPRRGCCNGIATRISAALHAGGANRLACVCSTDVDALIRDILVQSAPSARHKGVAAAVGLRRNLYPDAPPYRRRAAAPGDAA